jgi:DNA-binding MarR family transcriptional regulator
VAGPRWLNGREQQVWGSFLGATRLLCEQLDRELQRTSGMPQAYYVILMALSEAPEQALRMSDLAGVSWTSRSRLSHAVARMEEAGWVRRQECTTDRRGSYAVLTDEGTRVLEKAAPTHAEGVRSHLFDVLSPAQVEQLGRISDAIRLGLTPAGPSTAEPGQR